MAIWIVSHTQQIGGPKWAVLTRIIQNAFPVPVPVNGGYTLAPGNIVVPNTAPVTPGALFAQLPPLVMPALLLAAPQKNIFFLEANLGRAGGPLNPIYNDAFFRQHAHHFFILFSSEDVSASVNALIQNPPVGAAPLTNVRWVSSLDKPGLIAAAVAAANH